jgi:hypothetical protein
MDSVSLPTTAFREEAFFRPRRPRAFAQALPPGRQGRIVTSDPQRQGLGRPTRPRMGRHRLDASSAIHVPGRRN